MDQDKITAFDHLYSTNHIRILKVIASYLSPASRHSLAVYIKYLELQYTFSLSDPKLTVPDPPDSSRDIHGIFDEILPFCNLEEQKQINRVKKAFQDMSQYREMMEMMEILSENGGII